MDANRRNVAEAEAGFHGVPLTNDNRENVSRFPRASQDRPDARQGCSAVMDAG